MSSMLESTDTQMAFARSVSELLLERGTVTELSLERARRVQKESGDRLDQLLTRLGLVSERDMAAAMAETLDLPLVETGDYPDMPILKDRISPKFLKSERVVPIAENEDNIVLAMADPLDSFAVTSLELISGSPVSLAVGIPSEIDAAVDRLYAEGRSAMGQMFDEVGPDDAVGADSEEDIARLKDMASEAPVIRLVNMLIDKAVAARASDIHVEPFEDRLRVRYRVDGVLQEIENPPTRFQSAIISRIKLMAKLNIAEQRLPQDGRMKLAVRGKEVDFRISTVPALHGESVVMRVLDRSTVNLNFESLGFPKDLLEGYLNILKRPHGIILVTGPTGSGKTTTLYTSLIELNDTANKLLSVEDPVEYQLDGVNQVNVKPQIGLGFANILRSFLRQDPDVIMVGEIRDLETAQIAVQAALTGHIVLSTLHTNDAASSVTRLLDMGIEDYLLTSTVNGVLAQRLVRSLCPECREPYRPMPEFVRHASLDKIAGRDDITLYRAKGCEACDGTGFQGRTAIMELLAMTDSVSREVLNRSDARAIERAAVADGMRTLYRSGVAKAMAGETSIEEVLRVTRSE